MQCSRCHGHMREIGHPGLGRIRFGKARWLEQSRESSLDLESKLESLPSGWLEADEEVDTETGTFFEEYKSVLITCAVTALFSLTVLLFLSLSIGNLGVLAVPFLGVFLAGFALSVGLPFKILREYRLLSKEG